MKKQISILIVIALTNLSCTEAEENPNETASNPAQMAEFFHEVSQASNRSERDFIRFLKKKKLDINSATSTILEEYARIKDDPKQYKEFQETLHKLLKQDITASIPDKKHIKKQ